MHPTIQIVDQYLIGFYRLTGHSGVDFVIGTFVLAVICLLIGEVSVFLAFRATHKRIGVKTAEAEKYQNLAIDALKAGNKEAYQAANKLANDAFGHTFFQQAALSAAFLWPVCFALAWMQHRFLEVEVPIPGTPWSLGYIGVFICIYITVYFLFKRLKYILASLRRGKEIPDQGSDRRMINSA
ncbi:MAG: hypothetical protein ACOZFS_09145 [Thermodesulfobacteriota bacterium]